MNINISITKKIPLVLGDPVIVCGNSDYTITFTFDDEWNGQLVKTARFNYVRHGNKFYIDVPFTGNVVNVPILRNINDVRVGVYAGDLCTTAPAIIPCRKSILCPNKTHDDPADDIYDELLLIINTKMIDALKDAIDNGEISIEDVKNIVEYNKKEKLTFWVGTQAEYDAIETKTANCFYFITDADDAQEILDMMDGLPDRVTAAESDIDALQSDVTALESDVAELKGKTPVGKVLYSGIFDTGVTVSISVPGLSNYSVILVYTTREDLPTVDAGVLCIKNTNESGESAFSGVRHIVPTGTNFTHAGIVLLVDSTGETVTRATFKAEDSAFPTQCVTKIIGIA